MVFAWHRAWPDVALSRSGDWPYNHPRLVGDLLRSGLLSLQFPWMAGCKLNGEERIGLVIGCEEGAGSCAKSREGLFVAS
jgi:hypothetical protein